MLFPILYYGYFVLIVLVSLGVPIVYEQRPGKSRTTLALISTMLLTAFRVALFYICWNFIWVLLLSSTQVPPPVAWKPLMFVAVLFLAVLLHLLILLFIEAVRQFRAASLSVRQSQDSAGPQLPQWIPVAAFAGGMTVMTLGLMPWILHFSGWMPWVAQFFFV